MPFLNYALPNKYLFSTIFVYGWAKHGRKRYWHNLSTRKKVYYLGNSCLLHRLESEK